MEQQQESELSMEQHDSESSMEQHEGDISAQTEILNISTTDTATQTVPSDDLFNNCTDTHLSICQSTSTSTRHQAAMFNQECLSNDAVKFYTGLPNLQVLNAVFKHVAVAVVKPGLPVRTKLTPFQEFMLVMLKLRLNSQNKDLAFRFGVSETTVSRLLLKWLVAMDVRLRKLIIWPDRKSLQKTMPYCFRASFGRKVAVIIDCFEVFCEKATNLEAKNGTWSQYKHHNTLKVLIGITPQGSVSYLSDTWGGRVSDKYLTEHCGILDNLLPGDLILADRGFDIGDSVGMKQARLHLPAFTKGKSQLSPLEIEETRTIANVRIHVERVIGNIRQKYTILHSTLPIHFIIPRLGEDIPLIDRIVRVCSALINVCDSVVPFD